MGVSYRRMFGEKVAKGLSEKTLQRLGSGGRVLGRTGAVVGIGFLLYDFWKNYKENIEKEPVYGEMMILHGEMEKWMSAVSCIGRESPEERAFGSFHEGGAINALFDKQLFGGHGVKAADPKEACSLIGRSIGYIMQAENLLSDDQFEEKRKALVSRLRSIADQINKADDYRPIQNELAQIVDEIRPIEAGYASRIYAGSQEIQKTLGSNAAWAAFSTATLGFVKKPGK